MGNINCKVKGFTLIEFLIANLLGIFLLLIINNILIVNIKLSFYWQEKLDLAYKISLINNKIKKDLHNCVEEGENLKINLYTNEINYLPNTTLIVNCKNKQENKKQIWRVKKSSFKDENKLENYALFLQENNFDNANEFLTGIKAFFCHKPLMKLMRCQILLQSEYAKKYDVQVIELNNREFKFYKERKIFINELWVKI